MIGTDYAKFFESINKECTIDKYKKYFDENSQFKDPFNDVKGVEKIYKIFIHMYKNLDSPIFKIKEIIEKEDIVYINWEFNFSFKNKIDKHSFDGVSRVIFNKNGKVIIHEDYWDAASNLYEKLPIISSIIKYIKRRINE